MQAYPTHRPILDPGFVPAVLWNRAYQERCQADRGARPFGITLQRTDGTISRFDTRVLPHTDRNISLNVKYVERLVKSLLWLRGGYRVMLAGDDAIASAIREMYSPTGARKFDYEFIGRKVYGRPLSVESCPLDQLPEACESSVPLGRHLDGARIGFDLGGSDRKCAAVLNGKVVFSEEITWDPYFQSDPQYHYDGINDTLHRAAAHLPRVDAIGGSAAATALDRALAMKIRSLSST